MNRGREQFLNTEMGNGLQCIFVDSIILEEVKSKLIGEAGEVEGTDKEPYPGSGREEKE